MPPEPQPPRAGAKSPDDTVPQQDASPPDQSEVPDGESSIERTAKTHWLQSADQTGTVRATKDVPEPDSLGG